MNEILYVVGWTFNSVTFLIFLFWLKKFWHMRWKLFFGVKKDLVSIQHHELHSCFLTAFCFLVFYSVALELEQFLLTLELEKIEHIQLFYTSLIVMNFTAILTLFCLHLVRGCSFSPAARKYTYTIIIFMLLQTMQLLARGYYDYHELSIVYKVGGWLCNLLAMSAIAAYPIRSIRAYIKEKRAVTS